MDLKYYFPLSISFKKYLRRYLGRSGELWEALGSSAKPTFFGSSIKIRRHSEGVPKVSVEFLQGF